MCAWVAAIVQAVGSDVSAAGNIYNLHQQARAADTNAIRAQSAAADAVKEGDWRAGVTSIKSGRLLANQYASAGASGFDVTSESYRDVMAGSAQNYSLDIRQIRANALKEAEAYRMQSEDYRQAADAYRTSAIFSVVGGALGAGGQIASGVASSVDQNRRKNPYVTDPNLKNERSTLGDLSTQQRNNYYGSWSPQQRNVFVGSGNHPKPY